MMPNKIEDGTILYCDYLHLQTAYLHEKLPDKKTWKVESKRRPVMVLSETAEIFNYRTYCILQLTTQKKTAKRNSYIPIGKILGSNKPSYARPYPETYPDNLLDHNAKSDKIDPFRLSDIIENMSMNKLGWTNEKD